MKNKQLVGDFYKVSLNIMEVEKFPQLLKTNTDNQQPQNINY